MVKKLLIVFFCLIYLTSISLARVFINQQIININNNSFKISTLEINKKLYIISDDFSYIISGNSLNNSKFTKIYSSFGNFTFINRSLMYVFNYQDYNKIIQLNLPILLIGKTTYLPFQSLLFSLDTLKIFKVKQSATGFVLKSSNSYISQYFNRTNLNSDFVNYTLPELSETLQKNNEYQYDNFDEMYDNEINDENSDFVNYTLPELSETLQKNNEYQYDNFDEMYDNEIIDENVDLPNDTLWLEKELSNDETKLDEETGNIIEKLREKVNKNKNGKIQPKNNKSDKSDEKDVTPDKSTPKNEVDLSQYYPKTKQSSISENKDSSLVKSLEEDIKLSEAQALEERIAPETKQIQGINNSEIELDNLKLGYIIPKNLRRKKIEKYLPKEYDK